MWKTFLTKGSTLFIVGILCVSLWQTYKQTAEYQQKADTLEETINDLNQKIKYTKIQLNDSIAVYQAEIKNLNITLENLQSRYDRFLATSKTKPKDVCNVTEIKTVVHSIDTVLAYVDSFGGVKTNLNDAFVDIIVDVLPSRQAIIDYEVRDSLTILNIQKKHSWFFGLIRWKEPKSIKVINHNPKAIISSLQTIDIIE